MPRPSLCLGYEKAIPFIEAIGQFSPCAISRSISVRTRVRAPLAKYILQVLLPSGRNADKKQNAPVFINGYLYGNACNTDEEFLTFMNAPIRADNFSDGGKKRARPKFIACIVGAFAGRGMRADTRTPTSDSSCAA